MIKISWIPIILIEIFLSSVLDGKQVADMKTNPYAVATYECAGIYWKTAEDGICKVKYRASGKGQWKDGLEMVYDKRYGEYRGSIVGLTPDSDYDIELYTINSKSTTGTRTRSEGFPVGKITLLPEGESDKKIIITDSGTPEAYHLVTVPSNSHSVLNLKNIIDNGIEINADYVIIRGAEVRNAAINGILIKEGHHDIVIEQCYITFWGRIGGPLTYGNFEGDMDSGIYAEEECSNLTIQRNLIEDPRGAANDWETGHPSGPQGISIIQSKGGHVIRYNDIVSTEDHGYNDAIGGAENFSFIGNINCNSDIYGNIIRSVWDDAIESEGANMNVRIWGNYGHLYFNGIATATTSSGPVYIFRNVFGESRTGHRNSSGGAFIKTGEREPFAGGRRYIFHNTTLQPNGVFTAFTGHVNPNCITRNNIFDAPGRLATDLEKEPASDYDYDYFSGIYKGKTATGKNNIRISTTPSGTRLYISSYNLEFYPRPVINTIRWGVFPIEFGEDTVNITDPVVWLKNPLIDSGVLLPGFNENYKGSAPDIGAFETGTPPIQFGRRAYLSHDQDRAPWENY